MTPLNKLALYCDFVVLKHTVFAIPFAYLGVVLASILLLDELPDPRVLFLVTTAFFGARSGAMALNNLVDADIDKKNKRTAMRPLPAGLISKGEVYSIIAISYLVFFLSAFMLNELCLLLSPIIPVTSFIYPYVKRFSSTAHLVLGLNLGYAPLGGWLAVTGVLHLPPTNFDLGMFVLVIAVIFWVAGFDVIYSLSDVEFDKKFALHSIPACFGTDAALKLSSLFHVLMYLCLVLFYRLLELGSVFFVGLLVIGALIIYEHHIVKSDDPDKIGVAFLNVNAAVSISLLLFAAIDVLSSHVI
ncbi:MAG: 4-hydroxybenzoate octaprenyltransferase [Candidatus Argoarchaeum ethanivorans]|uniref:4-hydroxybenzoate octaprenyltransferase n=1 Tax=Candidatus Argoarchaeum ethanivorans TaxID=2608793 RepID=A0A811T607_9EURY|nr:MAG: 4-hydroxybenzoate octaprenyltransferase [Candidatus Argoarchaeum ethanivorans]